MIYSFLLHRLFIKVVEWFYLCHSSCVFTFIGSQKHRCHLCCLVLTSLHQIQSRTIGHVLFPVVAGGWRRSVDNIWLGFFRAGTCMQTLYVKERRNSILQYPVTILCTRTRQNFLPHFKLQTLIFPTAESAWFLY